MYIRARSRACRRGCTYYGNHTDAEHSLRDLPLGYSAQRNYQRDVWAGDTDATDTGHSDCRTLERSPVQ